MSHKFTLENATQIQRGTDQVNDIYAMVKFTELKEPVPYYAYKIAEPGEEDRIEMWNRLNSGEFGEPTFPPCDYPRHPLTQKQLEEENKAKRDLLLLQSDWTQTNDAPITAEKKAAYASYRQQLRDVTAQQGFPYEIVWPIKP